MVHEKTRGDRNRRFKLRSAVKSEANGAVCQLSILSSSFTSRLFIPSIIKSNSTLSLSYLFIFQDMAPKRKNPPPPTTSFTRVTRSSAKRSADESAPPSVVDLPEKKPKKPKTAAVDKKPKQEKPQPDSSNKTIVIEHCKQCQQFKKRAILVKEGLEKGVAGITVIVNPEKPRRGCFEIREEGGEKFITLLDMKRPFQPMRDLDMDKVISDIIDKIGK